MSSEIKNIVESVIFASEEEISPKQIKEVLDVFHFKASLADIENYIEELNKEYHDSNRSFKIIKIAGGYQFSTKQDYAKYIGKLFTEKQKKKLSVSALETLAVVAYKQPITRSEIEFIRGVNVDYIVNSLLERELINIVGRANTPGRPILYGTTKNFLKTIGLGSIDDLPKLREINEILKNEQIEGITEADIDLFNSLNAPSEPDDEDQEKMEFEGETPSEVVSESLYDTDKENDHSELDEPDDQDIENDLDEEIDNSPIHNSDNINDIPDEEIEEVTNDTQDGTGSSDFNEDDINK